MIVLLNRAWLFTKLLVCGGCKVCQVWAEQLHGVRTEDGQQQGTVKNSGNWRTMDQGDMTAVFLQFLTGNTDPHFYINDNV